MIRQAALAALLLSTACGSEPPAKPAPAAGSSLQAVDTLEASLHDLLEGLGRSGLKISTGEFRRYSQAMQAALPEEPLEKLQLGIDGEGMVALRFSSISLAQQMEERHKGQGLRYRNWYLAGLVTVGVDKKIRDALLTQ